MKNKVIDSKKPLDKKLMDQYHIMLDKALKIVNKEITLEDVLNNKKYKNSV